MRSAPAYHRATRHDNVRLSRALRGSIGAELWPVTRLPTVVAKGHFAAPEGQHVGHGPAPRYLWPLLHVFQPWSVRACLPAPFLLRRALIRFVSSMPLRVAGPVPFRDAGFFAEPTRSVARSWVSAPHRSFSAGRLSTRTGRRRRPRLRSALVCR